MVISGITGTPQEIITILEKQGNILTENNKLHLINVLVQCFRLIDFINLGKPSGIRKLNENKITIRKNHQGYIQEVHSESEIIRRLHNLVSRLSTIQTLH